MKMHVLKLTSFIWKERIGGDGFSSAIQNTTQDTSENATLCHVCSTLFETNTLQELQSNERTTPSKISHSINMKKMSRESSSDLVVHGTCEREEWRKLRTFK